MEESGMMQREGERRRSKWKTDEIKNKCYGSGKRHLHNKMQDRNEIGSVVKNSTFK